MFTKYATHPVTARRGLHRARMGTSVEGKLDFAVDSTKYGSTLLLNEC